MKPPTKPKGRKNFPWATLQLYNSEGYGSLAVKLQTILGLESI